MRSIVLVGLMGAGKSTVGRLVATRLGLELVDSDTAIEARTGSSVRELWESGGEASYRRLESQVVLDAVDSDPPVVIAAPGGVVMDEVVRVAVRRALVVWLRADPRTLARRVRPGDHRPLLGDDPLGVLTKLATDRADLYGEVADVVIDIDGLDADTVAEIVVDLHHRTPVAVDAHGD